jgi:O-antigen/teichoic acid export membrane protein
MPPSPRRALIWSFAERYAGLLISIGSVMLLSRLLTPAQVGVYSLCAAFTAVAGILRDFGISEYLIQEKDLTRDKIRSAYGLAFVVAWLIGVLVWSSRDLLSNYYNEPDLHSVLSVLALHFAILPLSSPTFALLNREMAFRQIFFLQITCNAAQAITSISLAYFGFGVMSLAWGPIANVGVQTLILIAMRPRDLLVLPGLREARTVLRFGSMFVASRAIEVFTRNAHEPVIGKVFGFEAVGLFSRAFGLIDLFQNNVAAAAIRVATPSFAALHRVGMPLAEPYARATAIFVSVSWPFFGFIALMAEPIIRLMFGAQWMGAAPIAVALAVSMMPNGLFALAPQMLSATGHVDRRLKVTLRSSPVHLVGVFVAAQFSVLAVACVWSFSWVLMMGLYLPHLRQILGTSVRDILRPCKGSAVVALSSIGVQALAATLRVRWAAPDIVSIPVTLAAGAVAWALAARALRHPTYQELAAAVEAHFRRPAAR